MADLTTELRTQAEESIKLIEKSGVKIIPMPAESDLKDFYRIHDQVAQKLTGTVYPKEVLDKVYKILKRPQ